MAGHVAGYAPVLGGSREFEIHYAHEGEPDSSVGTLSTRRKQETNEYRYISDIGAHQMQPLFIAGGTVTVVSFTLVFITERWLRHSGRLTKNTSWVQKILSILATIAALAGMIGLIILTCKNDVKYDRTHDICLGIFM